MKWILILIAVHSATPVASLGGDYASMVECFEAREYVMEHPYAEPPAQAVCVRTLDGEAVTASLNLDLPR